MRTRSSLLTHRALADRQLDRSRLTSANDLNAHALTHTIWARRREEVRRVGHARAIHRDEHVTLQNPALIRRSARRHAAPAHLRRRVEAMLQAERPDVARQDWRAAGPARERRRSFWSMRARLRR